ncbi:hypothetical protein L6Q96_08030 [Candidatus Binatia bacterium]|nr:hypothetical protein [Candidatus Binatia bacterium]
MICLNVLPRHWSRVRRRWHVGLLALLVLASVPGARVVAQQPYAEPAPGEEPQEVEPEADVGRHFLYLELVLSGFYSSKGLLNVPFGNTQRTHLDFNPRPPGNYVGVDYVQTFGPQFFLNEHVLPDWLPVSAIDLHPRITYEQMEPDAGIEQWRFAPQDFWVRFNPGGLDRVTLRAGQFVIPYGVNPIFAPRQRFLLPLEATDLGLKWDWGLDLKGPIGEYDWETAATIGWGEGIHSCANGHSYLLMGRVGAPTYWDLQYGASFLYGELPMVAGALILDCNSISRWRFGLDSFYKYGTYLMSGLQFTYGQDGFAGGARYIGVTGGKPADVLGALGWVDWVLPWAQDLRLAMQAESVIRDLGTPGSDNTAVIFEAGYSILTSVSLMLDYRIAINSPMDGDADGLYFTFIYYGS